MRKDLTDEAHEDANQQQFAGYNIMSIQYAQAWSAGQMESFLRNYDCKACRTLP